MKYEYTGGQQTFTPGYYGVGSKKLVLEVWGAKGFGDLAGKGGYSKGANYSIKSNKLYVYVGGSNTYNGGGTSCCLEITKAGGASDIRDTTGELTCNTNTDPRIVVAGGGGGISKRGGAGGVGGGANQNGGHSGNNCACGAGCGDGGTLTTGGTSINCTFNGSGGICGKGAEAGLGFGGNSGGYAGAGGGGWYGGGAGGCGGEGCGGCISGGGGGSGYCRSGLTCNGESGVREGNGYAKISW